MTVDRADSGENGDGAAEPWVDAGSENATALRLIDSAITLIAKGGLRGLTIRDVAALAQISFPSVQYHFPTKARLVEDVFAAVERRHCSLLERSFANLRPQAPDAGRVAGVVSAVLSDWCGVHAPLTIAVHEMLLAAYRDPGHVPFGGRWIQRQHDLWSALLIRIGGTPDPDTAWFIIELLVGLSLMSLGGERAVETGLANAEIVQYAFADMAAKAAFDPYWYRAFLDRADEAGFAQDAGFVDLRAGSAHPAAQKILDASIAIVAEEGSGALTFRGVASRARVAIASVTNNFHTRENLIYRVYRRIQDDMAELGLRFRPRADIPAADARLEGTVRLLQSVSDGKFPLFLAAYDLILASARDPLLGKSAWRIRIMRGIYLLIRRGYLPAPSINAQFVSHISSLWTIGVGLVHPIRAGRSKMVDQLLVERLKSGFDRLDSERGEQ